MLQTTSEPLLGSADIQSLADLGNSFEIIRKMRVLPIAGQRFHRYGPSRLAIGPPLIINCHAIGRDSEKPVETDRSTPGGEYSSSLRYSKDLTLPWRPTPG